MRPLTITRDSARYRALVAVLTVVGIGLLVWIAATGTSYDLSRYSLLVGYAVAILGLDFLVGHAGQISAGHAAFFATGMYTTAILTTDYGWPYLATLAPSALIGLGAGGVVGAAALRIRGLYLAILTLALSVGFPPLASSLRLTGLTGGANGKSIDVAWQPPAVLEAHISPAGWKLIVQVALAAALFLAASWALRGRHGRAVRAVRDSEMAAATFGLNVAAVKSLTFSASAGYAALGGSIAALTATTVSPESGAMLVSVALLTGLIVGGPGRLLGVVIGAGVVVWLPEWSTDAAPHFPFVAPHEARILAQGAYGLLLILVLVAMPSGIAGLVRGASRHIVRIVPHNAGPAVPNPPTDTTTVAPATH